MGGEVHCGCSAMVDSMGRDKGYGWRRRRRRADMVAVRVK